MIDGWMDRIVTASTCSALNAAARNKIVLRTQQPIGFVTALTHRHRYVRLCSGYSTLLLHSVPANAARRPYVPGHVRTQRRASSADPLPRTLPVPLHRCSPRACVGIQRTESSLRQASL